MKIFLILSILSISFIATGCTTNNAIQEEAQNLEGHTICVDGIEYLRFSIGHQGYMAPHFKSDKFNNPKVIKCGDEE